MSPGLCGSCWDQGVWAFLVLIYLIRAGTGASGLLVLHVAEQGISGASRGILVVPAALGPHILLCCQGRGLPAAWDPSCWTDRHSDFSQ